MWLVTILLLLLATPALGAEARCDALGANCVCSEPLQATQYQSGPSFWNPNDSTTKECGYEVSGHPISRNAADIQVGTDAEAINALPSGSTARANGRFLRAANNHEGIYMVGHYFPFTSGYSTAKRMSLRWYRYYSTQFAFADERWTGTTFVHDETTAGCRNSKWTQIQPGNMIFDSHDGPVGMYGIYTFGWTPNVDCCPSGHPGGDATALAQTASMRRGKWWRHEAVIVNPSGGSSPNGLKFYLYMKNVTDGAAEYTALNGTLATDGWPVAGTTSLTPPSKLQSIASNNYRQHGSTTNCTGWEGNLYMLAAVWDTDTGQMIGPASEIESGSPSPPVGVPELTISSLIPLFWVIGIGVMSTICMVMGIRMMVQRRSYVAGHHGNGGDDLGQRARITPVDPRTPRSPTDRAQASRQDRGVVGDPRADELVGVGAEVERSAQETPRPR